MTGWPATTGLVVVVLVDLEVGLGSHRHLIGIGVVARHWVVSLAGHRRGVRELRSLQGAAGYGHDHVDVRQ